MTRCSNILSRWLKAAVLVELLLFMPAFAWGDSWCHAPSSETQTTNCGMINVSEQTIQVMIELTKLDPNFFSMQHNKSNASDDQGCGSRYDGTKYNEIFMAYDEINEINRTLAEAWTNKAIAYISQGMYTEAVQACDEAIRLDPNHMPAWNNRRIALTGQGKYDEAIIDYDKALSIDLSQEEVWNNKAAALKAFGFIAESDAAYAKANELKASG